MIQDAALKPIQNWLKKNLESWEGAIAGVGQESGREREEREQSRRRLEIKRFGFVSWKT
jgi:hypothetical protein